ncbi:hypothetical protein [Nonomuraea longicatena]|uniref:WD40 repeat domain-containing protein n=1 Tax=Nonomuraea longicatena TaxID=83682 RepID=A0ABN1NVF7_9ACTN
MINRIEQRLQDAFTAGAELVRPETLRPADAVPRPRRRRILAPAMAALVVVALIGLGIEDGPDTPPPVSTAAGGPRFLLTAGSDGLAVRDARTGKITDRVVLPPALPPEEIPEAVPSGYLLTGTGYGTTFFVGQSMMSRTTPKNITWFHRLRVDDHGKVAELTKDVFFAAFGDRVTSIAVSSDGTRLAYSQDHKLCGTDMDSCPGARIVVTELSGRYTRTWTSKGFGNIWSLSWAADHRTLAFAVKSEIRAFDTAAFEATLRTSRVVVRDVATPTGVAISPDARTILVGRASSSSDRRSSIEEHAVANGRRIRTVYSTNTAARWTLVRYDVSGRHLLIKDTVHPLTRLDGNRTTTLSPADSLLATW